jgi:hypothetical protein
VLKKIWVDPVWSKVIANGIWAAGGIILVAVVTYVVGWWPDIATLFSETISLAGASTTVPNWLLMLICVLAAFGLFVSLAALYRHITGPSLRDYETVRIIPDEHRAYWHVETTWLDGRPRTILTSTWDVLNILDRPVALPAVYIRSPRKARGQGYLPRPKVLSLPPDTLTSIDAKFVFCPAIHEEGKPIKATVIFLDEYKNEYTFKNTVFKPQGS